MRAGLLLLLVAVLCAATAAPARADSLVTRPHAKQPLSDKRAAKLVKRSRFEPRPANRDALRRTPTAAQLRAFRAQSEMPYARYVTGRFTGTTDEVIQWAARKWGFKPDLLRAVATVESWWRMSTVGDNGDSFGLFQVRRPFHCTEPVCEQFRGDAALNADYYGGILRSYYDGKQRWLNTVSTGENGQALPPRRPVGLGRRVVLRPLVERAGARLHPRGRSGGCASGPGGRRDFRGGGSGDVRAGIIRPDERLRGMAGGPDPGACGGGERRGARRRAPDVVLRGLRLGGRAGRVGAVRPPHRRGAAPAPAARARGRGDRRHPVADHRPARRALGRVPLAVGLFAAWCGWLAGDRRRVAVA